MRSQSGVASPLLLPLLALFFSLWISLNIPLSRATPVALQQRDASAKRGEDSLVKRTYFPDYPPSCQICEQHYSEIDSCANASIVFADVATILFNPLQFFDVIECACTDTFQSAYPQCVDCFEQTNQTAFLEPPDGNLSSVILGIRQICALGSAIFGHVGSVNSELPGQTPITVASAGAALRRYGPSGGIFALFAEVLGWSGSGANALLTATLTIILGVGMGVWTVI